MTTLASATAAGVGPDIDPELAEYLAHLSPDEQRVLAKMIGHAKLAGPAGRELDCLGLIHAQLKLRMDFATIAQFSDVETKVGPPVVESFPDCPFIPLPEEIPALDASLSKVLEGRYSGYNFGPEPLPFATLASVLQHAYGVRGARRAYNIRFFPNRSAPSAGGLQPIDLHVFVNAVDGLVRGRYYFDPVARGLRLVDEGNLRYRLTRACVSVDWITYAPVVFAMVINMPRIYWKYSDRGYRFAHADAGVLAQNLYLVGTALGLNTCAVASYSDDYMNELLGLDGRDRFTTLLFAIGPKPSPECAI